MTPSALPLEQKVRYSLFDYDSGNLLGNIHSLTVDIFTGQPTEIFCRLRDYLRYTQGMHFPSEPKFENCRDDRFGACYIAKGTWHGKAFGVIFTIRP